MPSNIRLIPRSPIPNSWHCWRRAAYAHRLRRRAGRSPEPRQARPRHARHHRATRKASTPARRKLVGAEADTIIAERRRLLDDEAAYRAMSEAVNPYGDGHAAPRILAAIDRFLHA